MGSRTATPTSYERPESGRDTAHTGVWVARMLCRGAVLAGLTAIVSIGVVTVSTSPFSPVRIVLVGSAVVFAWCSISFLCCAVVAAANAH